MNEFRTVDKEYNYTTVIEKSKFICRITQVNDEDSAKKYISTIEKLESGATHNCYAYILEGETTFKFSDDGEPHGTAGQPMLEALKSEGLKNVIAVVTRYFGGIKLGTGGLSRAYFSSVKNCLSVSNIVEKKLCIFYNASFDYNIYSKLTAFFAQDSIKVISTDFNNEVNLVFACSVDVVDNIVSNLNTLLNGKLSIVEIKRDFLMF